MVSDQCDWSFKACLYPKLNLFYLPWTENIWVRILVPSDQQAFCNCFRAQPPTCTHMWVFMICWLNIHIPSKKNFFDCWSNIAIFKRLQQFARSVANCQICVNMQISTMTCLAMFCSLVIPTIPTAVLIDVKPATSSLDSTVNEGGTVNEVFQLCSHGRRMTDNCTPCNRFLGWCDLIDAFYAYCSVAFKYILKLSYLFVSVYCWLSSWPPPKE